MIPLQNSVRFRKDSVGKPCLCPGTPGHALGTLTASGHSPPADGRHVEAHAHWAAVAAGCWREPQLRLFTDTLRAVRLPPHTVASFQAEVPRDRKRKLLVS